MMAACVPVARLAQIGQASSSSFQCSLKLGSAPPLQRGNAGGQALLTPPPPLLALRRRRRRSRGATMFARASSTTDGKADEFEAASSVASELQASTSVASHVSADVPVEVAAAVPESPPSVPNRKVVILVEPSPFSHVSGMKNRFQCLIRELRNAGDEVLVVTPDPNPPKEFFGARVMRVMGFVAPFYRVPTFLLSLGLSVRVFWTLLSNRPDILHVSSPGFIVFAGILYAKLLRIPLVVSYHTHIPAYIPQYTFKWLVWPMWAVIRFCHRMADVTLVTSSQILEEFVANRCRKGHIEVWKHGVDTEVFHPRFKSAEMRHILSEGHPDAPLIMYVGRLGAEKGLDHFQAVIDALPNCRVALVGDGPYRKTLEEKFAGKRVYFAGMMHGETLSAAYASADVFFMPSESETLGFVVIESMAAGTAVVAVRAGGIPALIEDGKTGFLYAPGDLASAVERIQALLTDRELLNTISTSARAAVEQWGWRAVTKHLREHQYQAAIQRKGLGYRHRWMLLRVGVMQRLRRFVQAIAQFYHSMYLHLSQALGGRRSGAL
eukprot:jgi/Chlat1/2281/Chrsp17S02582